MTEYTPPVSFEADIKAVMAVPQARPEFVTSLNAQLAAGARQKSKASQPLWLRPTWVVVGIILLLTISILIIGPERVYAAFSQLFGYIPGVGIVNQSEPIRVLAEPVSVTRDGITVTVTSATLTADRTQIAYRIFGVPASAYPQSEAVVGCIDRGYLRLKDGTQLSPINGGYQPVPADVSEAVFVIPCIVNTLPGKAPENWELLLRFVPAPPDLTVMPVIDLSPSPQVSQSQSTTSAPTSAGSSAITVNKEIETNDGYILIGQFMPQVASGESFQQTGMMKITDAAGKTVSYTYPQDLNDEVNQEMAGYPGGGWAVQFRAAGLTYPLTLSISGVEILPADPNATAEFTFDAGSDPQPGQTWNLNQEIQLAGHVLTLVSVESDSRNGYSFSFKCDPNVYGAAVQIMDYTSNGGGGGGGGGLTNGTFDVSQSFSQLPGGVLKVRVFNLMLVGDTLTWEGKWSPSRIRTDLPTNPTAQPGLCLAEDSLASLGTAPESLTSGKALTYEQLDNTGQWGLVLYNLDGSGREVLTQNGNWGSFSQDGSQMAYSGVEGEIRVIDLSTKSEKVLSELNAFDLHWSPDGQWIASVGTSRGNIDSIFLTKTDGTQVRQVSELSYESIIGWSPDGSSLYFVVPYTGGAAWNVYAYDLASTTTQELFTIENGTPKFLNPQLSLDGKWIAYRGRDNSSVYLVHPDGSDMHLVLDSMGAVGIEWSRSGWLGVSVQDPNSDVSTIILVNPDTCESYRLPATLHGQMEGLWMP